MTKVKIVVSWLVVPAVCCEFCWCLFVCVYFLFGVIAFRPPIQKMTVLFDIICDAQTNGPPPYKTYPNGTLNFRYSFKNKGKYVGLVTTKKGEFITSRFPFSVGIIKKSYSYIYYIILSILLGAGTFYIAKKIHVFISDDCSPIKTSFPNFVDLMRDLGANLELRDL